MKRLNEKFCFLTAILCLIGTMSTVTVVGNHSVSEKSPIELTDFAEKKEVIAKRCERRAKRNPVLATIANFLPVDDFQSFVCCRFFKATSERDNLNGSGTYLLT